MSLQQGKPFRVTLGKRKPKKKGLTVKFPKASLTKAVKQIVNRQKDLKQYEHVINCSTINGGIPNQGTSYSSFTLANFIVQGNAVNQREGTRITLNKLRLRMQVSTADTYNHFRVSIVKWKKEGVVSPLLVPGTNGVPGIFDSWNNDIWHVMSDRMFLLQDEISGVARVRDVFLNKKFNRLLQYTDTTGPSTDQIIFLIQSDSTVAPHPTGYGVMTLYFTDV